VLAFRLFIFDFDGTLADSGPLMFEILNRAAVHFKFRQIDEAELQRYRGVETRVIMRELGVKRWRLPQIARYFRRHARLEQSPPLFPGIVDTLHALHAAGVTLALVSSNSEAAVRRALGPREAALFHAFECNASLFGKARKFRKVVKATRCHAGETITIGDEVRDIEAARKAGLSCAAVTWGYAAPALLQASAPDMMIETPGQIVLLVS
jgi:phosphoglycolate phosphatase